MTNTKNVTLRAQQTSQGFIQAQAMATGNTEITAPLSEVVLSLLSDLQAIRGVLEALEESLPVKAISPQHDRSPDGLTAALSACIAEVFALRGQIETIANRIGRL